MSAKTMLCAMVAGTALVMIAASRPATTRPPPARPRPPEAPWLTAEAAAQIIGHRGTLGPLFDGLVLGGPAPPVEARARIAAFARTNHVEIDLEVNDGELAAVRFAVTYSGCCGYEGADVLALRMGRPETQSCCGCESAWIDDWAITSDDGVTLRGRVRVNRVEARWERAITVADLVERADGLLGMPTATVAAAARDRWTEIDRGHYLLEVPFAFGSRSWFSSPVALQHRNDLGLHVTADRGRVVGVELSLCELDDVKERLTAATLYARWGTPRVEATTWTWRLPDRVVTAELDGWPSRLTIQAR